MELLFYKICHILVVLIQKSRERFFFLVANKVEKTSVKTTLNNVADNEATERNWHLDKRNTFYIQVQYFVTSGISINILWYFTEPPHILIL